MHRRRWWWLGCLLGALSVVSGCTWLEEEDDEPAPAVRPARPSSYQAPGSPGVRGALETHAYGQRAR